MNVVIVEDEDLAAYNLEDNLKKQNILLIHSIQRLYSVEEMKTFFKKSSADLIFLDIHLADGNSLETLPEISITAPIIFTTAYNDYAVQAFKHFAIDYLLKPFDIEDLEASLTKFKSFKKTFQQNSENSESKKGSYQKRFLVNQGNKLVSIETDEISFFYGFEKYLFIYTKNENSYLYDDTIKNVINKLNPNNFVRINRNYIIHFNAVSKVIKHSSLKLEVVLNQENPGKEKVFVSKSEAKSFKKWLDK
ncbi:LytTR family two component transcriptional regulator [Tenacibaculum adriaticum]|uniref:LytTR family two component transcriptional regulator n=1 Tax=Tenacibaculum adriaticum TaxID=413713 RepID=A0A5S5DWE7_9FLAO|nr:LytTR family DNA-binding domain-containing protein [Tenacibaculum adriaticum]TYP99598.1 LytTR family two component transcriptional regulator [Tenacibaculum adriaticum]